MSQCIHIMCYRAHVSSISVLISMLIEDMYWLTQFQENKHLFHFILFYKQYLITVKYY